MDNGLEDLYQEVILDHNRSPRNYGALPLPARVARGRNPLCGDLVVVYVAMQGETIEKVTFEGSGCAISRASASLLTEVVKGLTRAEARAMVDRVRRLMTTGEEPGGGLGKLSALGGVHRFPGRVKCATLAWHALLAALDQREEPVTTEAATG
ncbi:MAG TPA: SUF system NifU family Fe-S cluster assembly protein [Verrucomicrobiota bacterium]|nr:SUF system NifU family Fe-S cluster assembly protein [Verrucomicrobiota bacterium]HNU52454.1 SUF system NifU family Fe-S cluster assembly protein [Verrucomicrobiota bacterium]